MKQSILLGTYTKKDSKGIYEITLDTQAKTLSGLRLVAEADNPTYLALSSDNQLLFSVSKVNGEGGTSLYKRNSDGTYSFVEAVTAEGAPPCYIGFDADNDFIFAPNYHKGSVDVLKLTDEHIELRDVVQHSGHGPNADRQDGPHAHYADLTPDGKYLVVCDLGTDEVYSYTVDAEGKLAQAAVYKASAGQGPRHMSFHPNGKIAYLETEMSSEVVVLAYDANDGSFTELQTISTLPTSFTGTSIGAAIRISPDGKFLYASNRGHESIAAFSISEDGKTLKLIQVASTEGKHPRDFNIDPSGQFLVVANMETDNLSLFERDLATGLLTLVQKDVAAPEAVCITFAGTI